jgi:hypothetical protein
MAAGDVTSISGLGSGLRSECEAGLPTETGSDLIGAGAFDILRRKVPSARGAAWAGGKAVPTALSSCNLYSAVNWILPRTWCDRTASHVNELRFPLGSLAVTYCDDAGNIAPICCQVLSEQQRGPLSVG